MWRRLDVTGMEACAVVRAGAGYMVSGAALYAVENEPIRIEYSVTCAEDWACRAATVDRWIGADRMQIAIQRRDDGRWAIDGRAIDGVDGLVDIDLGFTPATNTNAINRLKLSIGDQAASTAVWLDDETWTFKPLRQRYERLSDSSYRYLSVDSGYEAVLEVDDFGLIRVYPDLWQTVMA